MRILILLCLLLVALPVHAKEIAGVMVQETVKTADGTTLILNGAGIRTKFFFDIYIAELYMQHPSSSAEKVVADSGAKQIVMHFLYSEVSEEKLVDAWNEGFADNTGADVLSGLQGRIDQFNDFFVAVKKGDVITLAYSPNTGTTVTIAGVKKGVVEGKDFNDALLRIWLGKEPVTSSLKKKLLNYRR